MIPLNSPLGEYIQRNTFAAPLYDVLRNGISSKMLVHKVKDGWTQTIHQKIEKLQTSKLMQTTLQHKSPNNTDCDISLPGTIFARVDLYL